MTPRDKERREYEGDGDTKCIDCGHEKRFHILSTCAACSCRVGGIIGNAPATCLGFDDKQKEPSR